MSTKASNSSEEKKVDAKNVDANNAEAVMKSALRELKRSREKIKGYENEKHEPIAIIGMGCRYPGSVDSNASYWDLLAGGKSGIREMTNERWNAEEFYDPDRAAPGKMYTKAMGVVDSLDEFDADLFGIAPVEAESMDPQQRILMEVCWQAFEDAGIRVPELNGSKTSVYLGICHQDYALLQARYTDTDRITAYDGTGNAHAVASGRISYLFGLRGPSVSIDTACSSSLVSLHLACASLRSRESDLSLAGGINIVITPSTSIVFAKANMLAVDGRCKTFDASADGYVRAEGAGMLVLKRLSDAQRDGDNILAVIRGTAVNQDGRSQGLTAPNEIAQENVIRDALVNARLEAGDVSYIEAHGTGTPLGDPIEISALNSVYGKSRTAADPLIVGSAKTNIGHMEAAAGVGGVMKVVLALQNRQIPPHLNYSKPNPHIDWSNTPIHIPVTLEPWSVKEGKTRIAGVSSFGFSGTNSHVILEEAPARAVKADAAQVSAQAMVIGAKSPQALQELADAYIGWIDANPQEKFADLAAAANTGRVTFNHRLAFVAKDLAEARRKLNSVFNEKNTGQAETAVYNGKTISATPKVAFVYTGQGSQFAGMGKELYDNNAVYRTHFDAALAALAPHVDGDLAQIMWQAASENGKLDVTAYTQPALFAMQYALSQLWLHYGVKPSMVLGHSVGEYAAAVVAGVMTLETAARLIARRGALMVHHTEPGDMLAVMADETQVRAQLKSGNFSNIDVAAINGPKNVVVSGDRNEIASLLTAFESAGIKAKKLVVSHAFHSPLMQPMLDSFASEVAAEKLQAPRVSFISTQTAAAERAGLVQASYWVDHVRNPVKFMQAMDALAAMKPDIVIELGPQPVLINMAQQFVAGSSAIAWCASSNKQAEAAALADALAKMAVTGADINWRAVAGNVVNKSLPSLPNYPFQRQRYWIADLPSAGHSGAARLREKTWLYHTRWQEMVDIASTATTPGHWLVAGPAGEIRSALADALVAKGNTVLPLDIDNQTTEKLLKQQLSDFPLQTIANVLLIADGAEDNNAAVLAERAQLKALQMLVLAQQIAAPDSKTKLHLLTFDTQAVTPDAVSVNLADAPLQGFFKSLVLEKPDNAGVAIDAARATLAQDANVIAELLCSTTAETLLAVRNGQQFVSRVVRQAQGLARTPLKLKADASYLITGGTGGLGLVLADALIANGARKLILCGRRQEAALDDNTQAKIAQWRNDAISVDVISIDVADAGSMQLLVAFLKNKRATLAGVIHAAGIGGVVALEQQTADTLNAVLDSKVRGAWNLHEATRAQPLDFFVMYSSIASAWGSGGMVHYSAANQFLDALADFRHAQGLPALAVNWGPWGEAGMATVDDSASAAQKRGLVPMPANVAADMLLLLMATSRTHQVVVDADWKQFRSLMEIRRPLPLLSLLGETNTSKEARTRSDLFRQMEKLDADKRLKSLTSFLRGMFAQVLGIDDAEQIDINAPLMEMGIDSIMALEIKKRLEEASGAEIAATLIFDYPTIAHIARHFNETLFNEVAAQSEFAAQGANINSPIAIVGIGCRLPGAETGPESFWQLLAEGRDGISDNPTRWDSSLYLDRNPEASGKTYTLASGLVGDMENFDARFFGIAPREITLMEPQQRLALEMSWNAIEHAGYAPAQLAGSRTGVFFGIGANEYAQQAVGQVSDEDIMYLPTGNASNVISGRVSFVLGLQGPAMVIDTACSSSAVAIHTACQSLRLGESDLALAGGVNAILAAETFIALSKAQMLSPTGRCHTFDADADGYVRGEGAGVLLLKRLSDAERDGDRIIAIIRGSAVNQDGRSSSLTAPNGPSQQAVIRAALHNAGVEAQDVDWVETHGTGTPLGDPIEVQSLAAVYGTARGKENPLTISAVKTNIGHLESAAAVSSVIKAALSLQHEHIPAHLHFRKFNPHMAVDASQFHIPTQLTPYSRGERKRLVGVSSFGFSGTNVHMILEEAPQHIEVADAVARPQHVFTLSAKSDESLKAQATNYVDYLGRDLSGNGDNARIEDICYTAATGRNHFRQRVAIAVKTREELQEKLQGFVNGNNTGIAIGNSTHAKLAFLFTGQGSQYLGMAQDLYETHLLFRDTIDELDEILSNEMGCSLKSLMWDAAEGTPNKESGKLDNTQFTQPAIFAIEVALAKLWQSFGIEPDVLTGHSVGEYAAAVFAGVMSVGDAAKLISARGRLMQELTEPGAMLAIQTSYDKVEELLRGVSEPVSIAAQNAPTSTVVSGSFAAIDAIAELALAQDIEATRLTVSHAFHSHLMQPMLEEFRKVASAIEFKAPRLPFVSSVTGKLETTQFCDPQYWVRHVALTVKFAEAINAVQAEGVTHYLEIGPGSTLIGLARKTLDANGQGNMSVLLQSLRRNRDSWREMNQSIAQLHVDGFEVNWRNYDACYTRARIALPTYAYARQRFWIDRDQRAAGNAPAVRGGGHPLLGFKNVVPGSSTIYFEKLFGITTPFNLDDHRLYEAVVAPGAFHVSMNVVAAKQIYGNATYLIRDLVFPEPLVFHENEQRIVHYRYEKSAQTEGAYDVTGFSRNAEDADMHWTQHTSMQISRSDAKPDDYLSREVIEDFMNNAIESMAGVDMYNEMRRVGYQLGSEFCWIEHAWRKPGEALTKLRLPHNEAEMGAFLIPPGLMDSCFQSSIMSSWEASLATVDLDAIYIPFAVDELRFYRAPTTELWCHVTSAEQAQNQKETYSHRIRVYDAEGHLIIDVDPLHSKRAPKEVLLKALGQSQDDWYYRVLWKEQQVAIAAEQQAALNRHWIIVGSDTVMAQRSALLSQLPERLGAHGQVSRVIVTQDDMQDWDRLKSLFTDAFAPALNDASIGIIYALTFSEAEPLSYQMNAEAVGGKAEAELRTLLAMVQGMQHSEFKNMPRLWLMTRGAQAAFESQVVSAPDQASLWGFTKVLALEAAEFEPVAIDFDFFHNPQDIELLLNELAQPSTEKQVAIRNGERLVARLGRTFKDTGKLEFPRENSEIVPYNASIEEKGLFDNIKYYPQYPRDIQHDEIAVEIISTGLNFRDVMNVLGVYPGEAGNLGGEGVGRIKRIGSSVTNVAVGDLIIITLGNACLSSEVITFADMVVKKPDFLSINEATTIPVVYTTAYHGLNVLAGMKKGDKVLIHAGAGGVGIAAIYLAMQAGAEIYATASAKKRDYLRSIGVQHVFDSRTLDFADQIREVTGGYGVDIVLNSLAGEFITKSMALLAPGGRFIEIGKADIWTQERVAEFRTDISYNAFDMVMVAFEDRTVIVRLMNVILDGIQRGELKPLPYTLFSQSDAVSAFRYMAQGKQIGKIVISRLPDVPVKIHDSGSYLITGGAGGLGMLFAESLIAEGARHIVLTGRSAPKDKPAKQIEQWRADGINVQFVSADIGSRSDVEKLFAVIDAQPVRLAGVLHAAGVLRDGVISQQTPENLHTVLSAKVTGGWLLHEMTKLRDLDLFVLFSSVSSLLGSPGQSNYAAANAFLDGLAYYRRGLGLPAMAINWGPWAEVGMAANEKVSSQASSGGMRYIAPQLGITAFLQAVQDNPIQRGIAPIDWPALTANFGGDVPSFLSEVHVAHAGADNAELKRLKEEFVPRLREAPASERQAILTEVIGAQIVRVMGLDPGEQIDPNQPLQELGLDSLMAVELRNILCAISGRQLAATLLFKYPTVASLSAFLIKDMFGEDAEDGTTDSAAPVTATAAPEEDFSEMSEDELAELLAKELTADTE